MSVVELVRDRLRHLLMTSQELLLRCCLDLACRRQSPGNTRRNSSWNRVMRRSMHIGPAWIGLLGRVGHFGAPTTDCNCCGREDGGHPSGGAVFDGGSSSLLAGDGFFVEVQGRRPSRSMLIAKDCYRCIPVLLVRTLLY